MDDVLELVDFVADSGLEGVVVWLLRLAGLFAVVAGLGLWLLTDIGVVLPLVLLVGGLVLLVAPSVLLVVAELFG